MPRRRRAEFGTVIEVVRGRKYRIRYWADEGDGYRRHCRTMNCTKAEAYDELARLRLEHSADAPCPTVREAYDVWYLPYEAGLMEKGELAPPTKAMHDSAWKAHVSPRWGGVPCSDVSPLKVQQWIDTMGYSAAKQATSLLRQVLSRAVLNEAISSNPMDADYRLPSRRTVSRRDDGIWSAAELLRIWEAVRGEYLEPCVLLMAFGGCRVGESMAPAWDDVEMVDTEYGRVCCVTIDSQIENATGQKTSRLKNGWSARTAVIPGPMGERMEELSQLQRGRLLTNDGSGEPVKQHRMNLDFQRLIAAAGIERHPTKNLRSSWETYMHWDMDVPQDRIEKLMGHIGKGSRVTAMHYDRPMRQMLAETVAKAYSEHPFAGQI